MKSLLLSVVGLLLAASSVHAIPFRFLAWDDEVATRKLAVVKGGDTAAIEQLHPLQRTPSVNAVPAEGGQLVLRALDRKNAEGKDIDFDVKVAANLKNPLVLLLPDAKAPSGLRGFAIEDSNDAFPWGAFRVLNATGKPLAIALGNIRKNLPAGWVPVDLKPEGEKPLPVVVVDPKDAKKALYSAVWPINADLRRLVIVVPGTDPRLGPLALKVIPEDRRDLAVAAGDKQ